MAAVRLCVSHNFTPNKIKKSCVSHNNKKEKASLRAFRKALQVGKGFPGVSSGNIRPRPPPFLFCSLLLAPLLAPARKPLKEKRNTTNTAGMVQLASSGF